MSRDWTPQQNRWADKQLHFSKNKISFINPETNKEELLIDPESSTAKQYPNLYFLYGYELEKYILKEFPNSLVHTIESMLNAIVTYEDNANKAISGEIDVEKVFSSGNTNDDELIHLIIMWYTGALDPDFYYNTENNQLW